MVNFQIFTDQTKKYERFIEKSFDQNGLKCCLNKDSERYLEIHTKEFVLWGSFVGNISRPMARTKPNDLEIELSEKNFEKYQDAVVTVGKMIEKEFGVRVNVYVVKRENN